MKKLFTISLVFLMLFLSVFAEGIKIEVNGKNVESDVSPFIQNNRTMVPLRLISESLGYTVGWSKEEKTILINDDENNMLQLWIGKTTANAGSKHFEIDVAPLIKENRTFVPIRFIAENFKCKVDWDAKNKIVKISKELDPRKEERKKLEVDEKIFLKDFDEIQNDLSNTMSSLKSSYFEKADSLSQEELENAYTKANADITNILNRLINLKAPDKFKDTYEIAKDAAEKALKIVPQLKDSILEKNEDKAKVLVNSFTEYQIKMTELKDAYKANLKGESYKAREDIKAFNEKENKIIDNLMNQIGK